MQILVDICADENEPAKRKKWLLHGESGDDQRNKFIEKEGRKVGARAASSNSFVHVPPQNNRTKKCTLSPIFS